MNNTWRENNVINKNNNMKKADLDETTWSVIKFAQRKKKMLLLFSNEIYYIKHMWLMSL